MIDILLATYNGEKYLRELLNSLSNQTYKNIRIIACDDGSTDQTVSILKEYQSKVAIPLVINQNKNNLGVTQTFSRLMGLSTAPHVMFCDQDDMWKTTKVEKTYSAMCSAEEKLGTNKPTLVHTDLEVVNDSLNRIHPSYWKYTHIYPKRTTSLNRLMVQNVVTGCTMMCNRSLVELCGPIPYGAIMHDWWLALAAAAFGTLVPLPEQTICYRQHASNCLGAKHFFSLSVIRESIRHQHSMELKKQRQAQKFASVYHNQLSEEKLKILDSYVFMSEKSWIQQLFQTYKNRLYRQGLARNLAAIPISLMFRKTS